MDMRHMCHDMDTTNPKKLGYYDTSAMFKNTFSVPHNA